MTRHKDGVKDGERLRRNEEKWTTVLMEAGWTVFPSIILEKQQALGLDPIDINILLQLARHWWYSDNPPHPSKAAIAKCLNVDRSTVRKHIARMERDGFISRATRFDANIGRQEPNGYRFDGLIAHATPFANEFIALREKQRKDQDARRSRKKAKPITEGKTESKIEAVPEPESKTKPDPQQLKLGEDG